MNNMVFTDNKFKVNESKAFHCCQELPPKTSGDYLRQVISQIPRLRKGAVIGWGRARPWAGAFL